MTELSGQYLGRYYLSERLGEGGMAVVYKAYDTRLERDVAIKIIRSEAFPADEMDQVLKRFEREAKSLAKLSHPNIIKVYDYGEHEGSPYLVMEYFPSGTLKKLFDGLVQWQDAVQLLLPVAHGLAYAHGRGILHRDIKPANILISDSGEPMLSDFGIAKLFGDEQISRLTESGAAIGTPEYMAPEQWTGTTSPKSDLYSLGIVLYEMITGRKPYIADTPAAIMLKQATAPLPSPRKFVDDLPQALESILIKALAKEPENRYKDLNDFTFALTKLNVDSQTNSFLTGKKHVIEINGDIREGEISPFTRKRSDQVAGQIADAITDAESSQVDGSVAKSRTTGKFSRTRIGLLVGGVGIVLAAWLVLSIVDRWYSPAAISTEVVGITFTPISSDMYSLTFETTQTGDNLAMTATPLPAKIFTPTLADDLLHEIIDAKGVPMVLVPAGNFIMGSNDGNADEKPIHTVYLHSFYIDKYEFTVALYQVCINDGVCPGSFSQDYYNTYKDHPVVDVDWSQANTYCAWRNARIPTEAEWEKAARGTDGRTYPWGEGISCDKANYEGCVGDTSIVGSYESGKSVYGVYDLAGNVWEWVDDFYQPDYYSTLEKNAIDPQGPLSGSQHILRGGSFLNISFIKSSNQIRSSLRYPLEGFISGVTGFRCARDASP